MSFEEKNKEQDDKPEKQMPEVRYVPIEYLQAIQNEEDRIDLLELVKAVWDGRQTVLKTVAVFIIFGLLVAFGSSEEYTSQVRLMPETQQQSALGGLGGLARQFGISAGPQQSTEGIPPSLYPDVTQSTVFLRELLDYEIAVPEGGQATLMDYFKEQRGSSFLMFLRRYTIRLPYTVIGWFRSSDDNPAEMDLQLAGHTKTERLVQMSREEWEILRNLRNRISADVNRETGVVTIAVEMRNGVLAADVADEVVIRLGNYITDYRTEKARRDAEFIEQRFDEARERFDEAQRELARFNDENRGQLTAMARTEEQLLQSNYNLTFNLYNTMAERLEEARIKLQEETPVMNVLEPAAVPDRRSSPKRGRLLILYTVFGGFVGVGLIFGIKIWETTKNKLVQ